MASPGHVSQQSLRDDEQRKIYIGFVQFASSKFGDHRLEDSVLGW
jgi:hypothetical protein